MNRTQKLLFYFIFGFCIFLFILSTLLISIYYQPENKITYTTPLSLNLILQGIKRIDLSSIQNAITKYDVYFISALLISFIVFFITKDSEKSLVRVLIFASQGILIIWYGLGYLMIFFSMIHIHKLDGEWLGEHWPDTFAPCLWILYCIYLAILSFNINWLNLRNKSYS